MARSPQAARRSLVRYPVSVWSGAEPLQEPSLQQEPQQSPSALMREWGLRARKGLGQHFLADRRVVNAIVEASGVTSGDTVVEVGPGPGVLTEALLPRAGRVVAVELDAALVEVLHKRFAGAANLTLVLADAREAEPEALLGGRVPYLFVANLPYYAANPILMRFLASSWPPLRMVVMVQKEVAQRMTAKPGEMGVLSVAVQFYGAPRIVTTVPPEAFRPPPKVASAVVRIDVHRERPVQVPDEATFFTVVRAGFHSPRKHLRNSMAHGLGVPEARADELLRSAGVASDRRPATLGLEEWAAIARAAEGQGLRDVRGLRASDILS